MARTVRLWEEFLQYVHAISQNVKLKKNQSMKATTHETHDENDFDKPEQNVN